MGARLEQGLVVLRPCSLHPLGSRVERLVNNWACGRYDTCSKLRFHKHPSYEVGAVIARVRSGPGWGKLVGSVSRSFKNHHTVLVILTAEVLGTHTSNARR
jgi:hypothetical protein